MNRRLRESLLGRPLDPFSGDTRKHVALVAFLAWIGLGADGLSSACYGPEEAFLALGVHTPLSLYLAAMTAVTVFVIALAYNYRAVSLWWRRLQGRHALGERSCGSGLR